MKKNTPPSERTPEDRILLAWTAPQHPTYKRSTFWYICAAIVITLCIAYSIWINAWTFTIVIVLASIIYLVMHRKNSPNKTIALTEHGFQIEDEFTPWSQCNGFWLLQGHDYIELHIERKSGLRKESMIQAGPIDVHQLRDVLQFFIPELVDRQERFIDTITRLLKI